jgi:hypothetical protein
MQEKETDKEQLESLQILSRRPEFQLWRSLVVDGTIKSLEQELNAADDMPESILRAKLKHINSLKFFFYDVFKNIDLAIENNQDTLKEDPEGELHD